FWDMLDESSFEENSFKTSSTLIPPRLARLFLLFVVSSSSVTGSGYWG
ncbi:unnamed protein product, partial [Rotaria socialis]